jgi:GNAT superfamily N-acetyltransferase
MVDIIELKRDDEELLHQWYDAMRAALTDGFPYPIYLAYPSVRQAFVDPPPHSHRRLLAAVEADHVVGGVEIVLETEVNRRRAELELGVVPTSRRRGIGGRLFDAAVRVCEEEGRSLYGSELTVPADAAETAGALKFARDRGFRAVHREDHLVLSVPIDDDRLTELTTAAATGRNAYRIRIWTDRCPDDLVPAFLRLREQMDSDVPIGDITLEYRAWTEERLRSSEERLARNYDAITAAAEHRASGELVGYSYLLVPREQPEILWQDDTLVMPEHRGHRLGLALKLATYEKLRHDHPNRSVVHTWTEPNNAAMLRTNRQFGYRNADLMVEVERDDQPKSGDQD